MPYDIFALDWDLRMILIGMCIVFWIFTLELSRKANAAGIAAKKNYFLSFSFFFLTFALNFAQAELRIANVIVYPKVISPTFKYFIGAPDEWMVFTFLFFFLGAIPMAFAIERFLLFHKKVILTVLGIVALAMTICLFLFSLGPNFNDLLCDIVISVDYLAMIAITLSILILYLRIAIISGGNLRAVGLLIFFGFVLAVAGLLLSSNGYIGHVIMLVGFFVVFLGILQMK